jgi:hypothetical protein
VALRDSLSSPGHTRPPTETRRIQPSLTVTTGMHSHSRGWILTPHTLRARVTRDRRKLPSPVQTPFSRTVGAGRRPRTHGLWDGLLPHPLGRRASLVRIQSARSGKHGGGVVRSPPCSPATTRLMPAPGRPSEPPQRGSAHRCVPGRKGSLDSRPYFSLWIGSRMTADTGSVEARGSARSFVVDAALLVTVAPLALALVRVAIESRGDLTIMVTILSRANIVPIVGISILQAVSLIFPMVIVFAAFGVFDLQSIRAFFRLRWSWYALLFALLLTFLATPWFLSALAAGIALYAALIQILSKLLRRISKLVSPFLAPIWRKLVGKARSGHGARRDREELEKDLATRLGASLQKRQESGRMVWISGIALICLFVMFLPVPWSPLERIALEGGGVVYGMVTQSDEVWTTIVTRSNEIAVEKTADIRTRIVCPRTVLAPVQLLSREDPNDRGSPRPDICHQIRLREDPNERAA